MQFHTLIFIQSFLALYAVYLLTPQKARNSLLLAASYLFYAFWDWRFLSLILLSTAVNYYLGRRIASGQSHAKKWMWTAVFFNLSLLGIFKYAGFFTESLNQLASLAGIEALLPTVSIILPLGISFYTFQVMSYSIDVYRGDCRQADSLADFALYVAFFPQLIAGPIERAKHLLPQITGSRVIQAEQIRCGAKLFFIGIFKKIFVADNISAVTAYVFEGGGVFPAADLWIVMFLFAIQVYADFSGYSDMARGLAKFLGFEINKNFSLPFFSTNLGDFWQRWHMSLTDWIKDYIFYPLSLYGIAGFRLGIFSSLLITWVLFGFWHGGEFRFIAWGLYHGVLLWLFYRFKPQLNHYRNRIVNEIMWLYDLLAMLLVFVLFSIGILFFACTSVDQVSRYILSMCYFSEGFLPSNLPVQTFLLYAGPLLLIEAAQYIRRRKGITSAPRVWVRALVYYGMFYLIVFKGAFSAKTYYYFQF